MSDHQDISPQDAEAMVKRLFTVAQLLANVKSGKRRKKKRETNHGQKHDSTNVLYLEDETDKHER